jgi:hypothetical protein
MRVRVSSPDHLDDLVSYLTERGCVVDRLGEREVEASALSSLRHEYAHLDLALYVQTWAKSHPGVIAELVP